MLLGASGLKITLEVPAASEIARDHANDSQTFSYKDLICHVDSLQLEESISGQYAKYATFRAFYHDSVSDLG